jgi:small subunit ribosomal protein S6e
MPTYKIVVSDPKAKTAVQKEFDGVQQVFIGKKIGEKVSADSVGLTGYEVEITGGSDKEGFPMRKDIEGQVRKRVVLSGPPGFNPDREGKRKRKSVRGNTVSADIVQINLKVSRHGAKGVSELWGVKPKEKEKKEKPAAAEKKEEPKAEAKPEKAEHKHDENRKPEGLRKPQTESAEKHEHKAEKPAAELAEAKMGVKPVE